MSNDTAITRRLGLKHPIIQGPFGGGLSTVQLVAAVSNAGGLGSFGAHLLTPAQIHRLAAEIRQATAKPFALNLWVSDHDPDGRDVSPATQEKDWEDFRPWYERAGLSRPDLSRDTSARYEQQVEAILEVQPPVFSFVFGIPSPEILRECRRRGITTLGAATTLEEAVAAEEAGVDLILATGMEAGGHRPSFLRRAEDSLVGTLALVPQVAARVKIPVVAGGGIADARGMAAALALGAQAVQIGTAFLACEESGAHPLHRERLFQVQSHETMLTRAYTGRLARFIRNDFIRELEEAGVQPRPFPRQSWLTDALKKEAAAQGDTGRMGLYASQAAPLLRHRRAADLMASLVQPVS